MTKPKESRIEISKSAFQNNINLIKKYSNNSEIIAVIKANAYGHGANLVSDLLVENGINTIAVAYINEAIELRNYGFKGRILVLVPIFAEKLNLAIEYDLEITIQNFQELVLIEKQLERISNSISNSESKKIKVHLFLDTGMHRDGFQEHNWESAINKILKSNNIDFVGIMSHFAASESKIDFTYSQKDKLLNLIDKIGNHNLEFQKLLDKPEFSIHISNSFGIFNQITAENQNFTSVRPGISLHGVLSEKEKADDVGLIPTLTLKSNIIDIKYITKGETAGYSFRYTAESNHFIAIVPIGYADGYNFGLGNKSAVLIKGKRYKVIGSVCMDQIIINIGDNLEDYAIGEEVVLIGNQVFIDKNGNKQIETISVYEIAELVNTIPYEIFTGLSSRLNRILVD